MGWVGTDCLKTKGEKMSQLKRVIAFRHLGSSHIPAFNSLQNQPRWVY